MRRVSANPTIDKKLFSRTAAKVKSINLPKRIFRGGIRM